MAEPEIHVLADYAALAQDAAQRFVSAAGEALPAHGRFTVALAGGSTPAGAYRLLAQQAYAGQVDWDRTLVFFGDERCVPPDHPDSNYRMARAALLSQVPLPEANVFRIRGELPPEQAAADYGETLQRMFGLARGHWPRFDLLLLGIGEDGHTASLFPGGNALQETTRAVAVTVPPPAIRPQVSRVTLTLPVLNAAARVMFLVSGATKAAAVAAAFAPSTSGAAEVPAGLVRPIDGQLVWLLDKAAAAQARSS